MAENTMNNQQLINSTPEVTGGQGERKFTQDDVNRIVSERLAREREKQTQQPQENEREKALNEREQALNARESKYRCEDYLKEISISAAHRADFLEVLDTSDFDKFKAIVDRLGKAYIEKTVVQGAKVAHPLCSTSSCNDSQIAAAFRPKTL